MTEPTAERLPELRSEEVQDVISTPPPWLVRWGTIMVVAVLGAFFGLAWYFRYPDRVPTELVVTTERPPVTIVTNASGYLTHLQVQEGDLVETGQLLAVIENDANYEDVQLLKSNVETALATGATTFDLAAVDQADLRLGGMLQPHLNELKKSYEELSFQQNTRYDITRINQLNESIKLLEQQREKERGLLKSTRDQLSTQQRNVRRNQQLLAQGDISQRQYESVLEEKNRVADDITRLEQSINDYEIRIQDIRNQIAEVRQQTSSVNTNQTVNLQNALFDLQSRIQAWERQFLLVANRPGRVSFFADLWTDEQYVSAGQEILSIVPLDGGTDLENPIIGRAALPTHQSGKVEEGQRVLVKFAGFPYREYGVVEGEVYRIAKAPDQKRTYAVEVRLPQDLTTSYGRTLDFEQGMTGIAEIITEDRRFLQRILDKLTSAIRNN